MTLVYYRQAFDTVRNSFLRAALLWFGTPVLLVNLVMAVYEEVVAVVKLESGGVSQSFRVRRGCVQGDSASPILFIVCLHLIMLICNLPPFNNSAVSLAYLAYADDLILVCNSKEEASSKLASLRDSSKIGGLQINTGKTYGVPVCAAVPVEDVSEFSKKEWGKLKFPCPFCGRRLANERGRKKHITTWCTGDPDERSYKGTLAEKLLIQNRQTSLAMNRINIDNNNISLDDEIIKIKDSEVYLGSKINGTSSWRVDLDRRHSLGVAKFNKLRKVLCASSLGMSLKVGLFKVSISTIILHGSECWIVNPKIIIAELSFSEIGPSHGCSRMDA